MIELSSEIVVRGKALDMLNKTLEDGGNPAHAYLFVGPGGLGKTQVAAAFARALLGSTAANHPDMLVLEKQLATIRIAEIRRLHEWLAYKPYAAQYRVVVVPEAHLMNDFAANALLKTLEEPPEHAVIVLVADQDTLPATVVSRCQVIRFSPLAISDVAAMLKQKGIAPAAADMLAVISEGCPGRALAMAETDTQQVCSKVVQVVDRLVKGDLLPAYETAESMEKDRAKQEAFLAVLEVYLRDALFNNRGLSVGFLPAHAMPLEVLEGVAESRLKYMIAQVSDTRKSLGSNANALLLHVSMFHKMAQAMKEVV
ncbi:MAG: ATP-binding protein [Candidatus Saccharibacteria bacterium]